MSRRSQAATCARMYINGFPRTALHRNRVARVAPWKLMLGPPPEGSKCLRKPASGVESIHPDVGVPSRSQRPRCVDCLSVSTTLDDHHRQVETCSDSSNDRKCVALNLMKRDGLRDQRLQVCIQPLIVALVDDERCKPVVSDCVDVARCDESLEHHVAAISSSAATIVGSWSKSLGRPRRYAGTRSTTSAKNATSAARSAGLSAYET